MRIVFMGTPDFAVPSLQTLIDQGHEICGVYTQPDKPKGRGHKLLPPPVKELALRYQIPVYQPATLREEAVQRELAQLDPELIVVVAYGKLLPPQVLELPKLGCINVHGSLLPKYRGAAPIQWAVLNGDALTGVTTMYMAEGMDSGDILQKVETEIGLEETAGELFDRLKILGAQLLADTLNKLESGDLTRTPQNEDEVTLAPMLKKEMSTLDWTLPAQRVHDHIRGLNPWPCATAVLEGKRLKLLGSRVIPHSGEPGSVCELAGELVVCCGEGSLRITELQTEKGKRMGGREYLLGHPLSAGTVIE